MFKLDLTDTPESSFSVLPEGKYNVVCEDAEIKSTKDLTGEYINAKMSVLSKDGFGKKIFVMFNIKNKNPKAVEIGVQQLKGFMKAGGMTNFVLTSASDICGLKALATVKISPDTGYGEKNVISYFAPTTAEDVGTANFSSDDVPF